MQTAQSSLTILNAHAEDPRVFWNGQLLEGVKRVHVHNDEDESRVKIVVEGNQDSIYVEMMGAGINIKKIEPKT